MPRARARASRPVWRDPNAVNLTGFRPRPVFDGGYYLFESATGDAGMPSHVGVILANRAKQIHDYRLKNPLPWRKALAQVLST